jgi:hypothetical protein
MSRARLILAALMLVGLAMLMDWQLRRERMVKACVEEGGVWYGPLSTCKHQRPILQRDLHRS